MNFKKILVLAPHTDDGELGCGGAIHRFIQEGKEVFYVAFSICEESVPEGLPKDILETEVKSATKVLGIQENNLIIKKFKVRRFPEFRQAILDELIKIRKVINPDLVFMPSSYDIHQDHSTIFQEGRRAFKNVTLLGYEFMWNNFSFSSSCLIKLDEGNIEHKIDAVKEYKSQDMRFYGSEKLIKGLANFRGLQISTEYAEAFEVIRWVL